MADRIQESEPEDGKQSAENFIRPFQLEVSSLRGRIVRLGAVLDEIITRHDYPPLVNQLLAETLTLCALLASMVKFDGIFTLQASGDGPIRMLVADMTSDGKIRACASFNEERLITVSEQLALFARDRVGEGSDNALAQLLGKGYIAFTVDHRLKAERYQGIVELKGQSLVECVQHYFTQSEQIDTGIKLAVGQRDGQWRAGGIMVQQMPEEGGEKGVRTVRSNHAEDDWRRAMILMQSCTEDEILSPVLSGNDILIRLFHEEGVRVYEPFALTHECRCTQKRVENIFRLLSVEDQQDMIEEESVNMTCEFCSRTYSFDPKDIAKEGGAS